MFTVDNFWDIFTAASGETVDGMTEVLDSLAVAYGANGNFDKAIQTAKRAITQADSEDKGDMAERIRKRIELYKNGQIYIDEALKEQK